MDAVVFTELLYLIQTDIQCPRQRSLRFPLQLQIGEQRRVAVATIEILGVPLLVLLESRRLALLGFNQSQLLLRHVLRCKNAATISGLYVVKHDVYTDPIKDDMVGVEEPIDMLSVAHHFGMEQSATIELEGFDEPLLLSLRDPFDGMAELLLMIHVDGLEGFTLIVHSYPRKECGVRLQHRLDGATQALGIKTPVKDIKIR